MPCLLLSLEGFGSLAFNPSSQNTTLRRSATLQSAEAKAAVISERN